MFTVNPQQDKYLHIFEHFTISLLNSNEPSRFLDRVIWGFLTRTLQLRVILVHAGGVTPQVFHFILWPVRLLLPLSRHRIRGLAALVRLSIAEAIREARYLVVAGTSHVQMHGDHIRCAFYLRLAHLLQSAFNGY